ncbi:MAG: 60S ribosomal protein L24 [Paramarteilia canceri]
MKQNRNKTSQASKIRKRLYNAPAHKKYKIMSCQLSPELRNKLNTKALSIKKGDTAQVVGGLYNGVSGQVLSIDRSSFTVKMSRVEFEKSSGQKVGVPIHYSKLRITKLKQKDPARDKILARKNKPAPITT